MKSSHFALDFVLSALISSKFESAKKLCEIFFFENKQEFSFLYALVNSALRNNAVTANIVASSSFSEGLLQQFKLAQEYGFESFPFAKRDQEAFIEGLTDQIINENSQLRKFLAKRINFLRSFSEINALFNDFDLIVNNINTIKTNDLLNMNITGSKFEGSPLIDLSMAQTFLLRSEYSKAKLHFERAFSVNPFSLTGLDHYSTVLWHLNEKDHLYSLCLRLKYGFSDCYQFYIVKGNYYSFIGANERAINSFRKALEVDKRAIYALFLEGHDWLTLNNVDEAEKSFEKLLNFDPDSYMSYYGLGIVNYRIKKYERSLNFLKMARSINPFSFNVAFYCSLVLESLERKAEALDVLSEHHSTASINFYRKAKLCESLNLIKEAEIILKEAIIHFPNDPSLYYNLAEIYNSLGKTSSAMRLLKRTNELELNNPAAKEFINNIGL